MGIFGEFRVPTEALAFAETFKEEPNTVVEIDRVVASDEAYLTPYVFVSGVSDDAFESAAQEDGSVAGLRRLVASDSTTMYRATWSDAVESIAQGYTHTGASIMGARGHADAWLLRVRFDERATIDAFRSFLRDRGFSFELRRLHELSFPRSGSRFGLTSKQQEALLTAWEMGYFELPRDTSMAAVAEELGISPQSFSDRLRRAQQTLVGDLFRPLADGL